MADERDMNPYDLNSTSFNPDIFLQKLMKTSNLKQIMDAEAEIAKGTQTLHSEMQTLVYENYNKFISATDAIRQMKSDFKMMESEMQKLADTMDDLTASSDQITGTLQDTRTQLNRLYEKNALLKRLSAISTLPAKLKQLVEEKNYSQCVQEYMRAQKILQVYGNQAVFKGIQEDCVEIIEDLKKTLKLDFKKPGNEASKLMETGELLLNLGEKPSDLSREMLQFGSQRLYEQILNLKDQTDRDMIEFVDMGIDGFLNDITLISSSFNDMFVQKHFENEDENFQELALTHLSNFVNKNMEEFLLIVNDRIDNESDDSQILLRALDRLYRRLSAMQSLGRNLYSQNAGIQLVIHSADRISSSHFKVLKDCFNDNLSSIRLTLVSSKNDGIVSNLNELITTLYVNIVEKIRAVLKDLNIFLNPQWSFSAIFKNDNNGIACIERIRENLLIEFLLHILSVVSSFSELSSSCPANLLLVLSKVCMKFESGGIQMQLSLFDELFEIDSINHKQTTEDELNLKMLNTAKNLIEAYVRTQGKNISLMIRKSVETRDWINCLEPRSVRAVMKRILDELSNIDETLEQLFESEIKTTASSDSSRRTHGSISIQSGRQPHKSTWSNYASSSHLNTSFVNRLFSERIDIFSSQIEFSKISMLSGIIKILLKTFLECARMQTFSKYGLQQIQVDTHFLQLNLWRFVSDENVVHFLLDDILGSAVLRCYEKDKMALLMEPNAVEIICERF